MRIETFTFQPFASRAGLPDVIGLRFAYNPALAAVLKGSLARHKARAVDRAQLIYTAGGWLPEARVWFVEPAVWPLVSTDLARAGADLVPVPRPADVPHVAPPVGATASPPARSARPVWTGPEDEAEDRAAECGCGDAPPDQEPAYALVSAAAQVVAAPTHRLPDAVIVRVPAAAWDAFTRETERAAVWKATRLDADLDSLWRRQVTAAGRW